MSTQPQLSSAALSANIAAARARLEDQQSAGSVFQPPSRRQRRPASVTGFGRGKMSSCHTLHSSPFHGRSFDPSGALHQLKHPMPAGTYGVHATVSMSLTEFGLDKSKRRQRQKELRRLRRVQSPPAGVLSQWEEAAQGIPKLGMSEQMIRISQPRGHGVLQDKIQATGCQHSSRNCAVRAACCDAVFPCRECHDLVCSHQMTHVSAVICLRCQKEQPPSARCTSRRCRGKPFARYHCDICEIWEDRDNVQMYHCHDCGRCNRGVGFGVDMWHCHECKVCLPLSGWQEHKCKPDVDRCGACLTANAWSDHSCTRALTASCPKTSSPSRLSPLDEHETIPLTKAHAVTAVQRVARGRLARRRVALYSACRDATIELTSVLRTVSARQNYADLKQKKRCEAATRIQALVRLKNAIHRVAEMRELRASHLLVSIFDQPEEQWDQEPEQVIPESSTCLPVQNVDYVQKRREEQAKAAKTEEEEEELERTEVEFMGCVRVMYAKPKNMKAKLRAKKAKQRQDAKASQQRAFPAVGAELHPSTVERLDSILNSNPALEPIQAYHRHLEGAKWIQMSTGRGSKCSMKAFINEKEQPGVSYRREKSKQSQPGHMPETVKSTVYELEQTRAALKRSAEAQARSERELERRAKAKAMEIGSPHNALPLAFAGHGLIVGCQNGDIGGWRLEYGVPIVVKVTNC